MVGDARAGRDAMTTYERRGMELGEKIGEALRLAEMWRRVADSYGHDPVMSWEARRRFEAREWVAVWLGVAEDYARLNKRAIPHLVVR